MSVERQTAYVSGKWGKDLPAGMTIREIDVLTLIAVGLSNDDIAAQLTLSSRTVTTHVSQVMRKLGVSNRTAAAVIAVDQGIIRLPFPGKRDDALDLLAFGRSLRRLRSAGHTVTRRSLAPMRIGAVFPLLGSASSDGHEMVRGAQLAVDELNVAGVDGRKVELDIVGVDVLDSAGICRAFETLAARNVDALVAGYTEHQIMAQELAAGTEIPYLHSATMDAMADSVRDNPRRYASVFQVCPGDSSYAPRFVEMMSQIRQQRQWRPSSRKLIVARAGWTEAELGVARAREIADRQGWELDLIDVDHRHVGSFRDLAARLTLIEPAAVMLGNFFVDGASAFMDAFLQNPPNTLVYFQYTPSVPEFREQLGGKANGVLWATVTGTYSDGPARVFASKYSKKFGMFPGRSHAGISYDRVVLLGQAWRTVQKPKDPKMVLKELRHLIHRGVNGVYYFGNESQTALSYPQGTTDMSLAQAHLVFQIQDERHRILSPEPLADGNFVLPPWVDHTTEDPTLRRPHPPKST
jgi:branched-chain amino acid transport system substrate-binding protein